MKAEVKEYEKRCASQDVVLSEKNTKIEDIKNIREKEVVIAALEENIRDLEMLVSGKNNDIANLKSKLEGVCQMSLLKESQDRYQQMITRYKATEKHLLAKMAAVEKELAMAREVSVSSPGPETQMSGNFQELLKSQIEENTRVKADMKSKIEEIYALKNRIEEQQIKEGLLENEVDEITSTPRHYMIFGKS